MSSAKEQYLEDQSYRIDKQTTEKAKKKMEDSINAEFDRRVEQGKLIIEEKVTSGTSNSSDSGSISRSFCVLHCLISPFSNLRPK